MSGILDLLNSDFGKQIASGISNQTGADQSKTNDVLSMALPVLTGAMQRNASTPEGAAGLLGALSGKHDGSVLDNLDGFFGGGVDDEVLTDGSGILGHVLGAKQNNVQNALSKKSGLDSGTISQILTIAAPLLLGYLGKQTKQNKINSQNDLGNLFNGLQSGNSPGQEQSFIESILDADGDGNVIDDVADMVLGAGKKKGGLGGLLGGFFKK